ncbi:MAG TPA: hypothetical protein VE640_10435 [Candidatus Bathyarchaeia archaeon]|nr:hypothetical protein [Candidatus Bathyarchaeia archaeon]
MSDRDPISKSLDAVARALARRPDDDDERASTFARGLALGALVGAAIAGSTIWQRRHAPPPLTSGSKVQGSDEPPG